MSTLFTQKLHIFSSRIPEGVSFPGALPGFFIQEAMLKIEHRSVASLVPYARNARTHSDDQVAQIAASIREFGWTNPMLVNGENGIIAGHGRLMAARKLGMTEVPVIELAHLLRNGTIAPILRCDRQKMAGLHRENGGPGIHWTII